MCRDLVFNRQPLNGSITSLTGSTLTMTGVSVLNPASASQLLFRCRLGMREYKTMMKFQAL